MTIAIGLSLISAALLVAMSGHNPLAAFAAMATGAVGSPHQIGVALNRATPYLLAGGGVAICFRAGVINIGAEGQIALGGSGAAAVALHWPDSASALAVVAALLGAAAFGALWAAVATAIHLGRRVHEVLVTLLLNFVALLLVQQVLSGPLGQSGAGFLQSPAMPAAATLWQLPGLGCECRISDRACRGGGIVAGALAHPLWLRSARHRGVRAAPRLTRASPFRVSPGAVMLLAGALAGLAGGVEVLGVHHRLIEGFSLGFGFKGRNRRAAWGARASRRRTGMRSSSAMLEAGSQSMQRQIGVPSALIFVIEGVTMLFVLAATVRRA